MATDRRTALADAVIETLAQAGSRGLTHRAVDQAAGLPLGSTSYYLRARSDLLRAAVDRLAELDESAVTPATGNGLAADLAAVMERMLTVDRHRLVARYELSLEAVRRAELRDPLTAGTRRVRDAVADRLETLPRDDAVRLADDVLALIEGILFTALTSGQRATRRARDFEESLVRLLGSD